MHVLATLLGLVAVLAQSDPVAAFPGLTDVVKSAGKTGAMIVVLAVCTGLLYKWALKDLFDKVLSAWRAVAESKASTAASYARAASDNATAAATHREATVTSQVLAATQHKSLELLDGMLDRVIKAAESPRPSFPSTPGSSS